MYFLGQVRTQLQEQEVNEPDRKEPEESNALVRMPGDVAADGQDGVDEAAGAAESSGVSGRVHGRRVSRGNEGTHRSQPTPKRMRMATGGASQPLQARERGEVSDARRRGYRGTRRT